MALKPCMAFHPSGFGTRRRHRWIYLRKDYTPAGIRVARDGDRCEWCFKRRDDLTVKDSDK